MKLVILSFLKTTPIRKLKKIFFLVIILFSSSMVHAAIIINHKLDDFTEYKIRGNYNVMSYRNLNSDAFTFATTYILYRYNSIGIKTREILFEARCIQFDNIEPSYIVDNTARKIESTEECSKFITTVNSFIDSGKSPRILFNHKNGKFILFRE